MQPCKKFKRCVLAWGKPVLGVRKISVLGRTACGLDHVQRCARAQRRACFAAAARAAAPGAAFRLKQERTQWWGGFACTGARKEKRAFFIACLLWLHIKFHGHFKCSHITHLQCVAKAVFHACRKYFHSQFLRYKARG